MFNSSAFHDHVTNTKSDRMTEVIKDVTTCIDEMSEIKQKETCSDVSATVGTGLAFVVTATQAPAPLAL